MTDKYQRITNDFGITFILRLADQAWIPCDPGNRDYQQYLKDTGQ